MFSKFYKKERKEIGLISKICDTVPSIAMFTIRMQHFKFGTYILREISEPSFPISRTCISPERSHVQFLNAVKYIPLT